MTVVRIRHNMQWHKVIQSWWIITILHLYPVTPIFEKDNKLAKINQNIVADRNEIQFIF